jgi:hypothetical protein
MVILLVTLPWYLRAACQLETLRFLGENENVIVLMKFIILLG